MTSRSRKEQGRIGIGKEQQVRIGIGVGPGIRVHGSGSVWDPSGICDCVAQPQDTSCVAASRTRAWRTRTTMELRIGPVHPQSAVLGVLIAELNSALGPGQNSDSAQPALPSVHSAASLDRVNTTILCAYRHVAHTTASDTSSRRDVRSVTAPGAGGGGSCKVEEGATHAPDNKDPPLSAHPTCGIASEEVCVCGRSIEVLGCGAVRCTREEQESTRTYRSVATLQCMYVRDAYRGTGVGYTLLQALKSVARSCGVATMTLVAGTASDASLPRFDRWGFAPTASRACAGSAKDGIAQRVVLHKDISHTVAPTTDARGTPHVVVQPLDPCSSSAKELLSELDAILLSKYPPEGCSLDGTSELNHANVTMLTVEDSSGLLGCAAIKLLQEEAVSRNCRHAACSGARLELPTTGPWYAELKRVYTRPIARGHGVGSALISALEGVAIASSVTLARLETGTLSHAAIGMYGKLGYQDVKAFGVYLGKATPVSVFMAKRLRRPQKKSPKVDRDDAFQQKR